MIDEKTHEQILFFKNRLLKNKKHLLKWASKNKVYAFRVYDKDIPEIPLCVDVYYPENNAKSFENPFIVFTLYKRPYEKNESDEKRWLSLMQKVIEEVFEIKTSNIFFKLREKRKQNSSGHTYQAEQKPAAIIVREREALFHIRFNSLLDTGLFLDHRFLRREIFETAKNKSVLNLFCYTGSFSVQAKLGGAARVISVDLSENYLTRAKENYRLNKLPVSEDEFIASDVFDFLLTITGNTKTEKSFPVLSDRFKAQAEKRRALKNNFGKNKFDIIICDAPTFSNSKKTKTIVDINRDWIFLCNKCLALLNEDGVFYFSCNSKTIKLNTEALAQFENNFFAEKGKHLFIKDLSKIFLDEDFKNKKPHTLICFAYFNPNK